MYQLDQDLHQVDDYLSCLMTALINEAVRLVKTVSSVAQQSPSGVRH